MASVHATAPLADIYRGGFAQTKTLARSGDARATDAVSKQFEAYLLQQMLKSMRNASFGDPLSSSLTESYRDLFDHQLTLSLAEGKGMGLSAVLNRALQNVKPGASTIANWESNFTRRPEASWRDGTAIPNDVNTLATRGSPPSDARVDFANPQTYINALRPHALVAAKSLGVDASVLIAQSALETGWGKHVMAHADGRSSYNMFGIKADASWSGDVIRKPTLEFEGGVIKRIRAGFRSYNGWDESFRDYVEFIQGQPRYADAVAKVRDPRAYVAALQQAGYATDPRYADKVLELVERVSPNLLARR